MSSKNNKMSPISQALSCVAGQEYLQLDEHVANSCRPVEVVPRSKRSPLNYATWKPRGSVMLTVVKVDSGTVIFCHADGKVYHAAPCMLLAPDCPSGTAFLGQYCMDKDSRGQRVPRVLVFDLVWPPMPSVQERGAALRSMSRFIPLPICVVQWVGELGALEGFIKSLPHDVESLIGLSQDPLKIYRHLRVVTQNNKQRVPGQVVLVKTF